ncbi:MAG: peptidase S8, partial [Firmicutes bacterium]|nr:peptidase S8 [Bacillota bacterium]
TSTAAAITSGIFAMLLEGAVVRGNNPIINSAAAATFAIRGTEKAENIMFPNNIWGFGTINIYEAFRKLL